MDKKTKKILTIAYIISFIPMILPQYGGCRGIDDVSGIINLLNPIGILSVILFYIGVWAPSNKQRTMKIVSLFGCVGIVLSEIFEFLTWHYMTITGEVSIQNGISYAFPEFYIGLGISLIMILIYTYFAFFKKETWYGYEEMKTL